MQPDSPVSPGIYPMLYAMFDDAGALRHDAFRVQVDAALDCGTAGVAILGLGTEVHKLTDVERMAAVETVAGHLAGRASLMVTVFGATAEDQIAFARHALDNGASWLVLQPPPDSLGEADLKTFYSTVMEALDCPIGIQNAPEFLGYGLSSSSILELVRRHPNFVVAKLECPATDLAEVVEAAGGDLAVFNGRCGLELPDNLRGGAAGIVPGIETVDLQQAIWSAGTAGDHARADVLYQELAPVVGFIMQGIPHFIAYGKALAAVRLGIEAGSARKPAKHPTAFGQSIVARFADQLGKLQH